MLPTLIVIGSVVVAAFLLIVLQVSARRQAASAPASVAGEVLRQSLAQVPANAFDARARIVRRR